MSNFSDYMGDKTLGQWLRLGDSSGTTATDSSGNGNDGSYEGTYTLSQTGLVTGDSDTAVLLGSDGKVNLGDITTFENAGTAGYTIREAFKPTSDYGAGTAREVWLSATDSTDGLEVAYETGNLEITHGLETYQIATTYTAGEIYRLILSYNATTKLLEVYQNDSLLGSNTFTNALVMPDSQVGENWESPVELGSQYERANVIKVLSNGDILVGMGSSSGDGILKRSTDGGQTFSDITLDASIDDVLAIEEMGLGVVLIGTGRDSGDGDIWRSTNYGLSPSKIELGATIERVYAIKKLDDGSALAGTGNDSGDGKIWQGDSDGLNWAATATLGYVIYTIEDLGEGVVLAGGTINFFPEARIWRSTNYGVSFDAGASVAAGVEAVYNLKKLDNGRVLCGGGFSTGDGKIYYNDADGVGAWQDVVVDTNFEFIVAIEDFGSGNVLCGGGFSSGDAKIYKSKDYGNTWALAQSFSPIQIIRAIANAGEDKVYMTTGDAVNTADFYISLPFSGYVGGQRTVDEYSYEEGPTDAADVADDYTVFTGSSIVPNVTGLSLSDAQNAITAAGFVYGGVEYIYNKDFDNNKVLTQSPKGGEYYPGGSYIYLTVSYNTVYKTVLCYDNLCTQSGVTVVASSTATGTFVENLYDDATDYWKSAEV